MSDPIISPWRGLMILLALAHIVGTVGYISVMAMAPLIRVDLNLNATQVGSFMSAFYVALAISALPAGLWVDRIGVGRGLALSMGFMAMGALGFAIADGYLTAVLATFVMGVGYGLVNPATAKGVLDGFGPKERATAMGVKQMGVPIGGLLAAGVGAGTSYYSWRDAMIGAAVFTGLVGVAWWLRRGPKSEVISVGPMLLWTNFYADLRAILANANMRAVNFAGFNFNMSQQSISTYLTLFLRDVAGASQPVASLCLGGAQVASAVGRVLWALISDRRNSGRRKGVLILAMALGTGGCFLSITVGPG